MGAPTPGEGEAALARVWDLPTRVVHWSLVLLLPVLWWTAEQHLMDWHRLAGVTVLGLVVFRLLWGLFGSSTARFSSFVRGPGAVWRYARGLRSRSQAGGYHGHNPMGGWSVAAMLGLLCLQVSLGLFATDVDGLESGPLSRLVSFDAARTAAELHETVFNLLLALVVLHVAAVVWYLVARRDNLVGSMIHGRRRLSPEARLMRAAPLWRAVVAAALAGALAYWIFTGARLG